MRLRIIALSLVAASAAACSGHSFSPAAYPAPVFAPPPFAPATAGVVNAKKRHFVYWTLYAEPSLPQIQVARAPLKTKSKVTSIDGTTKNGMNYTSGLTVDKSGRLWVLAFGPSYGNPAVVLVFKTPMKATSVPEYTFTLSDSQSPNALAFDPSGNLWVSSPGNHDVLEYTGPFTKSGTLTPAITLNGGTLQSYGVAFDKKANLYISISNSTGTDSIAVDAPPYNTYPFFLSGLTSPGNLAFDKNGNLYTSSNAYPQASIVRYNSNDLQSGDTPSIVDTTGIPSASFMSSFAFDAKGNLYAANCGGASVAGVAMYPTGKKPFSSKLAPTVTYTNSEIESAACVWGIAVH